VSMVRPVLPCRGGSVLDMASGSVLNGSA
jgi:hypothetical protein